MSNIAKKIANLQTMLEDIFYELHAGSDGINLAEKQQQLAGIERTIQGFQKTNTTIPDALRHLKLKLVVEIEKDFETTKAKDTLRQILSDSLNTLVTQSPVIAPSSKKRKKKKKSSGFRVLLADLIREKILTSDTRLFSSYKGEQLECVLLESGQLDVIQNGQKKTYDNPSSAAAGVIDRAVNGWTFWKLKNQGKEQELDYFRRQYLKKIKQQGGNH